MTSAIRHPRVALRHRLDYRFDRPVRLSTHWLRLRPAPQAVACIQAYSLTVRPASHFVNWVRDPFENHLARLDFPEAVSRCSIDMELLAELPPTNPFDFLLAADAAEHPFRYPDQLAGELAPYLWSGESGEELRRWLDTLDRTPAPTVERIQQIATRTAEDFRLEDHRRQPDLSRLLRDGSGSHRELAWLLTLSLRALGIATRLVSGYRLMITADAHAHLHSWCDAYLPGAGWIGLDPASGLLTAEHHIPLCTASDPTRVLPVLGYRESCEEELQERISLRLLESHAADWPYSAAQWTRLESAAASVDAALRGTGIRLGQSTSLEFGKPDQPDAPEWRTTGQGPDKWRTATRLMERLREKRMPGSIILLGQGEWYAGEPAPRWALHCIGRRDGQPLWSAASFSADRAGDEKTEAADAARFAKALAGALGLPAGSAVPAFEDQLYQLWSENAQVDYAPDTRQFEDPVQRSQLAEQLSKTHAEPTGHVIPLAWDYHAATWRSRPWQTRRQQLYLTPGPFPMGYRLPLNTLPAGDASRAEQPPEYSPWDAVPTDDTARRIDQQPDDSPAPPTAICVEYREDRLCVFLPPLPDLGQFQRLLKAVDQTASELGLPVLLEGYGPPPSPALELLTAEPETGTLRLRLPLTTSWQQELDWLEDAYRLAGRLGLATQQRYEDGRREPLGQRSTRTLGGPEPASSPFLFKPALLRSLILFWQHHPSLSYLFAGPRVGPDGWAPRVDEGSEDAVQELTVALERFPAGDVETPWVADRLLSHVLSDPGGDPHGGEWRLHALYPPDSGSRRLGQVELQAFAMAPHPHLAAAQSLLVRAVTAYLARHPLTAPPARWGEHLHHRFMLPAVLWQDFCQVLRLLADNGLGLAPDLYSPWLEHHFPVLGTVRRGTLQLRLRPALEPWPVMAEEAAGSGVARFVDPATLRVQVEAAGLTAGRHLLTCNGQEVPLERLADQNCWVGGVRCKVWNPPSTLFPTIPPVERLQFSLLDRWSKRRLCGFTYFPPIPGDPSGSMQIEAHAGPLPPGAAAVQERPTPTPHLPLAPPIRGGRFIPEPGETPAEQLPPARPGEPPLLLDLSTPQP